MRDTTKLIINRAAKNSVMQEFLDNIMDRTVEDLESLDIKRSDKKLLRTNFDRLTKMVKHEKIRQDMMQRIEAMPQTEPEEIMYEVLVYEGPDTTYDHCEVPTGSIITEYDNWIRIDFYRIKQKHDTTSIISQCRKIGDMNIYDANKLIKQMVNHRLGGASDAWKDWRDMIRIG